MSPAAVELVGLSKRHGRRVVLDNLDLTIQGGVVTLLGANGAGKTTLLRIIATALTPDGGTVSVDGLGVRHEATRIEVRRRLGYLPQHVAFNPRTSVFDALDYAAVLKEHRDERQRQRAVIDVLDTVGLRNRLHDDVASLSGGLQRRLGLAHALLGSPSLLVLDEPAAGLDPDERQRLRSLLAERRATATIFVSTHLTEEAAYGDTVVVLDGGRIAFTGTPSQLAAVARGRAWMQDAWPPPDVRASWRQPDGRHRCLGNPPRGAELVAPTIEDGYLLTASTRPSEPDPPVRRRLGSRRARPMR